ncbi:MAG: SpoVG family protein [Eubacterium sp.]
MLLTSLRINLIQDSTTKLKAIANLTFDNMLAVHDVKILETEDKLFFAMPSKKLKNDTFVDIVHPINAETREALENILLSGYLYLLQNNCNCIDLVLIDLSKETLINQNFEDFQLNVIL